MPETAKTAKTTKNVWEELRKPFPTEAIGKMPRGGIQLDYVGHAAVTDRLNTVVGPDNWNWEPIAYTEEGEPRITIRGQQARLWGRFTINGVTKPAVGTAQASKVELEKELIGDLIRNGAMRFGVALELWSKDELESHVGHSENKTERTAPPGGHYDEAPAKPQVVAMKNPDEPVTDSQIGLIEKMLKQKRVTKGSDIQALITLITGQGTHYKELTKGDASTLIDYLMKHQEDAIRTDLIAHIAENMNGA